MALWIIGGILLLLILLLLLRVGVHLRFGEQLELTVIAGPARIQLLPRPEKTETEQKTKQKKKAKGEAITIPKPIKNTCKKCNHESSISIPFSPFFKNLLTFTFML